MHGQFAFLLSALVFAAACTSVAGDPRPSCEADGSMAINELQAQIEGEDWVASSGGYQLPPAIGLIAAFTVDPTNTLSLRLVQSTVFDLDEDGVIHELEGEATEDLLEAGTFPVDFELGNSTGEGADVTLLLDAETLHTGEGRGGFLRLTSFEDEGAGTPLLRGCFFFNAETQDGSIDTDVEGGSFALIELE